jgi:chromosome segregation ATPase
MVKIKTFIISPENSEEISDFMESVKVVEQGLIVSPGGFFSKAKISILYKDRDEVGLSSPELVTATSGELAKAQQQFVKQEAIIRGSLAKIAHFEEKLKYDESHLKQANLAEEGLLKSFEEGELNQQKLRLEETLAALKQKHSTVPKAEKEEVLKSYGEFDQELQRILPAWEAEKKELDESLAFIAEKKTKYKVDIANAGGIIKQTKNEIEEAKEHRDDAKIFIQTTKEFIKDLQNNDVEGVQ